MPKNEKRYGIKVKYLDSSNREIVDAITSYVYFTKGGMTYTAHKEQATHFSSLGSAKFLCTILNGLWEFRRTENFNPDDKIGIHEPVPEEKLIGDY